LQASPAVGYQPLSRLGPLALWLQAHLAEDLLEVLDLPLGLVDVILEHALQMPVGGLPEHLLLGL